MPRSTKRKSVVVEEAMHRKIKSSLKELGVNVLVMPLRTDKPPAKRFQEGDRCRLGGLQEYTVESVEWSEAYADYFVIGKFGVCRFYMLQKDVNRAGS